MLPLIILSCFLHFTVGELIYGRILLDNDEQKLDRLSDNSRLIVQLQNTLLADAPAVVLQQIELRNFNTFPISYQMDIPTDISPVLSYSLSARILRNDALLYINDRHVSVNIEADRSTLMNIPVISVHRGNEQQRLAVKPEVQAWAEMLGKEGEYAVEYIKEKSGLTNVFTIFEYSAITVDYRTDRVRIFTNKMGIVTQVPSTG